jgi:bacterioferritin (cytochrome b1)
LRGAQLLLRLLKLTEHDADIQVKLTKHVADETRHAWLWTKRIIQMGGTPRTIAAGYQARIGMRVRPRTVVDLFALTIVVEERSLARYREHALRSNVDETTRDVLCAVSRDEQWHISWMRSTRDQLLDKHPYAREQAKVMIQRYRQVDEDVYAALAAYEREAFSDDDRAALADTTPRMP